MCSGCGTKRSDWVDPDTGYRYREPRWIVEVVECPGCAAIESERSMASDDARQVTLRAATPEDYLEVDA